VLIESVISLTNTRCPFKGNCRFLLISLETLHLAIHFKKTICQEGLSVTSLNIERHLSDEVKFELLEYPINV